MYYIRNSIRIDYLSNKLNRSCFIIEVIEVDSDDVDDDDYDDDVDGGVLGIFGKQPNKKQPRRKR